MLLILASLRPNRYYSFHSPPIKSSFQPSGHPSPLISSPEQSEVEWAIRIVIADEKAAESGRGAWTLDGKMIDAPVVGKAHAVVMKAEQCGYDVQELRSKWQSQEPE